MQKEERAFHAFLNRKISLHIETRHDGSYFVAEIPALGVSARGVTVEGAKKNVFDDALAMFKTINKSIVQEQYKSRDKDEGINIWTESLQRMYYIREILSESLDKTVRKTLVLKRHRRPMYTRIAKKGLRSASAGFQQLCMGRDCMPF